MFSVQHKTIVFKIGVNWSLLLTTTTKGSRSRLWDWHFSNSWKTMRRLFEMSKSWCTKSIKRRVVFFPFVLATYQPRTLFALSGQRAVQTQNLGCVFDLGSNGRVKLWWALLLHSSLTGYQTYQIWSHYVYTISSRPFYSWSK